MSADFLSGRDSLLGLASENERLERRMTLWRRVWLVSAVTAFLALSTLAVLAARAGGGSSTDPQNAFLFGLTLTALPVCGIAYLMRRSYHRSQGALGHWTAYLRARRSFYDRLALECEKASTADVPFSVFLVRLVGPARHEESSVRTIEKALSIVESERRRDDLAVAIGPSEIAVLSLHVRAHEAPWLAERLKTAVASAVYREGVEVRVGFAGYSERAYTADQLIDRARATGAADERPRGRFLRAA